MLETTIWYAKYSVIQLAQNLDQKIYDAKFIFGFMPKWEIVLKI